MGGGGGGDGDGGGKSGRRRRTVFVTVGTTCFDALVEAVDSEKVKEALWREGYTHLLIQMGRGTYIPSKVSTILLMFRKHFRTWVGWREYLKGSSDKISKGQYQGKSVVGRASSERRKSFLNL